MNNHRTTCDPQRIELFLRTETERRGADGIRVALGATATIAAGDWKRPPPAKTFGPESAIPCGTSNCRRTVCGRATPHSIRRQAKIIRPARPRC